MAKIKTTKLVIGKETLRKLDPRELTMAAGVEVPEQWRTSSTTAYVCCARAETQKY